MAIVKDIGLHLLVSLPLYLYGGISAWLLTTTPQAFQRFGAIGIVVGVLLFGLGSKAISKAAQARRDETHSGKVPTRYLQFHAREMAVSEVFLIVLGTLQSGYGDIFFCWINAGACN